MRKDQIFVLLLVVLLPLTGCFGDGSIGDAEAEENIETNDDTPTVLYVLGNTTGNITTQDGELVEILDVWSDASYDQYNSVRDYHDVVSMNFQCSTHAGMQTAYGIGTYDYPDLGSDWLPTDGTSCVYEFDRKAPNSNTNALGDLYIIYKIH